MRTLFTLGTLVAAVLVPWSSIAPSWLPDAAGSPVSESSVKRSIGPAARLNPALGILPLLLETPDEVRTVAGIADSHGPGALPPGVVCENGVCRIVDRPGSESSHRVVTSELKWDAVRERLGELGAVRLHAEEVADSDETRCSCLLPVSPGARAMRRFEATGPDKVSAVGQLLEQIETWRQSQE